MCQRAFIPLHVYPQAENKSILFPFQVHLFSSGVIQTPPAKSSTKTRAVQLQLLLLPFPVGCGILLSLETPKTLFNHEMRHIPFSKTWMAGVILKDLVKFSHTDPLDPGQSIWVSEDYFGPYWPIFFNNLLLVVLQNQGDFWSLRAECV